MNRVWQSILRRKILIFVLMVVALASVAAYREARRQQVEEALEDQADPRFGVVAVAPVTSVVETPAGVEWVDQISREVKKVLPVLAPVYRVSDEKIFTAERVQKIADYFGRLTLQTLPGGRVVYTDGNRQLVISELGDGLFYSVADYSENEVLPTAVGAGAAVGEFLAEAGLDFPDLEFSFGNFRYVLFVGRSYPQPATPSAYDSIILDLRPRRQGFEVVSLPYDESLISFIVGPGNEIVNFKFIYRPLKAGSGLYPLIDFNEAWRQLEEGRGVVVEVGFRNEKPLAEDLKLDSIVINDVRVGLLQTRDTQEYVTPAYVFSGVGTFGGGVGLPLTILLPALPEDHLERQAP